MVDGQPKEVSVWIFTKDSLPDYGATLQELKAPKYRATQPNLPVPLCRLAFGRAGNALASLFRDQSLLNGYHDTNKILSKVSSS
jgi:hypothetical protein